MSEKTKNKLTNLQKVALGLGSAGLIMGMGDEENIMMPAVEAAKNITYDGLNDLAPSRQVLVGQEVMAVPGPEVYAKMSLNTFVPMGYERDMRLAESAYAKLVEDMRPFVEDEFTRSMLLADDCRETLQIKFHGSASPESGAGELKGLDAKDPKLAELAEARANMGALAFVRLVVEEYGDKLGEQGIDQVARAITDNPDAITSSEGNVPVGLVSNLQELAGSYGLSLKNLVDTYNRSPGELNPNLLASAHTLLYDVFEKQRGVEAGLSCNLTAMGTTHEIHDIFRYVPGAVVSHAPKTRGGLRARVSHDAVLPTESYAARQRVGSRTDFRSAKFKDQVLSKTITRHSKQPLPRNYTSTRPDSLGRGGASKSMNRRGRGRG